MALQIKHAHVSAIPDDPTKDVSSAKWNASHTISGTKDDFNAAATDGDFMFVGDAPTAHTQTASTITDFNTAADARVAAGITGKQDLDATLTALAALNATAGAVEQTGADTFTKRAFGVAASTSILTRADGDARFATAAQGTLADSASQPGHGHSPSDVSGLGALATLSSVSLTTQATGTLQAAQAPAHSGDVTSSAGSLALTIQPGVVTNAMLADMGTARFKGRSTAGTGQVENMTATEATALLDLATTTAKGLAPARSGNATEYLNGAGAYTTPAAGAAGSSGQLQVNSGGALAGATNVEIENNLLRLDAVTSPATPATGGVAMFGTADAGRTVPAFKSQDGLIRRLQTELARSWPIMVRPQAGAASFFLMGIAAPTATGTAGAVGYSTATDMGYFPRVSYNVTVAATTAVGGFRTASLGITVGGATANRGGFAYSAIMSLSSGAATATHRMFHGLINQATGAPTDVEPSTQLNCIGIGYNAADTEVQIMHNDGSGACTKIPLGPTFPKPTADNTDLYEIALLSPKGTTQQVDYLVTNRATGAVAAGSITTNLPANTLFLRHGTWASVGGTSSIIGVMAHMIACDPLL